MAAAILPAEQIAQRRDGLSQEIIELWQEQQGANLYALICPNGNDCGCMPGIRISGCYFPGELDYFTVIQPFHQEYGFQVCWHCDVCMAELSCVQPVLTPVAG